MNLYVSAVNHLRHPEDQPSIGLILCKTRDRVVAEYALRDLSKMIGISEYQLAAALPDQRADDQALWSAFSACPNSLCRGLQYFQNILLGGSFEAANDGHQ